VSGFSRGGWTHLPPPGNVEAILDGQQPKGPRLAKSACKDFGSTAALNPRK
jgi:hypothetical protein